MCGLVLNTFTPAQVVIDGFYLADGQGCLKVDSNMYSSI